MPDFAPDPVTTSPAPDLTDPKQMAHRIDGDLNGAIFEDLCNDRFRYRLPTGTTVEDLSGTEHADLYDPECWPLVLVDAANRRFEVDVQVTVHALPDVAGQAAQVAAETAKYRAVVAAAGRTPRSTDPEETTS